MRVSNSEVQLMFMERTQQMRKALFPEANAETLAAWHREDQHQNIVLQYYLRQEEQRRKTLEKENDDLYNLKITSEVKLKK